MSSLDDFVNGDESTEALRKYLRFELETAKKTKWEINKEQFKIYVACCLVMEKIADYMGGEVIETYKTQMKGENWLFNANLKRGDIVIKVTDLSISGELFEAFQQVLNYSVNFGICPTNDEQILVCMTIPDVYIDKGIEF